MSMFQDSQGQVTNNNNQFKTEKAIQTAMSELVSLVRGLCTELEERVGHDMHHQRGFGQQ